MPPSKIEEIGALISGQDLSKTTEASSDHVEAAPVDVDAIAAGDAIDDAQEMLDHDGEEVVEAPEEESWTETSFDDLEPELQGKWKNLERGFHRKMQELSEKMRDADGMKKDAELFRQMMENPEKLRKFVESMSPNDAQNASESQSEANSGSFGPDYFAKHSDLNPEEIWDEENLTGIESVVYKVLREKIEPLVGSIQPHLRYIENHHASSQEKQMQELVEKYPGIESQQTRFVELTRKGLTPEEAARAVGGAPASKPAPKQEQQVLATKQRQRPATLSKPTVNSSSTTGGKGDWRSKLVDVFAKHQANQ